MVSITVLSKQPPGGRCSLYLRYAAALQEAFGLDLDVCYCEGAEAARAPAILLGGAVVEPGDGVIVAPEDLARELSGLIDETASAHLLALLNKTQEDWMEEWTHG